MSKKSKKKKGIRLSQDQRPQPIPAPRIIPHAKVYNRKKLKPIEY